MKGLCLTGAANVQSGSVTRRITLPKAVLFVSAQLAAGPVRDGTGEGLCACRSSMCYGSCKGAT